MSCHTVCLSQMSALDLFVLALYPVAVWLWLMPSLIPSLFVSCILFQVLSLRQLFQNNSVLLMGNSLQGQTPQSGNPRSYTAKLKRRGGVELKALPTVINYN